MFEVKVISISTNPVQILVDVNNGGHPLVSFTTTTESKVVDVKIIVNKITLTGQGCRMEGVTADNYLFNKNLAAAGSKVTIQYNGSTGDGEMTFY